MTHGTCSLDRGSGPRPGGALVVAHPSFVEPGEEDLVQVVQHGLLDEAVGDLVEAGEGESRPDALGLQLGLDPSQLVLVPSVTHGSLQGGHPEWSSHSYSHMTQPHDLDNHLALDAWVAKDAQ